MSSISMVLISKINIGSGGTDIVTFDNIPQTFSDLTLYCSIRSRNANLFDNIFSRFNNLSAASSYSTTRLNFFGNSNTSSRFSGATGDFVYYSTSAPGTTATASSYGSFYLYLPRYSQSGVFKQAFVGGFGDTIGASANSSLTSVSIRTNDPITSFFISSQYAIEQNSTFYLYGTQKR